MSSVTFALIAAFSVAIYVFISRYSYTDFYKRLEIRSFSTARSELDTAGTAELIRDFKGEYLEKLEAEKHVIIPLKEGTSLEELARQYQVPRALLKDIRPGQSGSYQNKNIFYCGILFKTPGGDEYYVITSAHNYYYEHHMSYLRSVFWIALLVSTILILILSYWLSRRLTLPIKRITSDVARVGSDNLNLRLEYNYHDDEMSELVAAFNDMLNRLETSFETQNNFISNASHELNTPLTSIIGEADVALSRERSKEEYTEALSNILNEAEKLNKKTKALLFLAQTAFNGKALVFKPTRIDQLIFDVHQTINRIHPDHKVHIDLSLLPDNPEKLTVNGNEQLLHLALSNVLLNAYKYSDNQPVTFSLGLSEQTVILYIRDTGIGIPADELKFIYDPFFRASNTGNYEGYGIGLPLTRNIVRIHHGELRVHSVINEGTVIEIRLPLA